MNKRFNNIDVYLLIVMLVIAIQAVRCKQVDQKASIGYGEVFFREHCAACHGVKSGFRNAPSLLSLNENDSSTLIYKLKKVKTVHGHYFDSLKYSDKEINSLFVYIKDYTKPHF